MPLSCLRVLLEILLLGPGGGRGLGGAEAGVFGRAKGAGGGTALGLTWVTYMHQGLLNNMA